MMIWNLILAILWALCFAMAVYLTVRIHRFSLIQRLAENHKALAWLFSVLPVAALGLFALINIFTMLVVLLHFFLGFVLCDAAAFLVRKASKKNFGRDAQILAAVGLTVLYLGAGWFFAHHVFFTEYTFSTEKEIGGDLRIVEITDSHLGITLDGEGFARQMERIQQLSPDAVVIV